MKMKDSFIPSNNNASSFVTFDADNGDHNPESLYGKSLHRMNIIMIQPQEPNQMSINEEHTTISNVTYQSNQHGYLHVISMDNRSNQHGYLQIPTSEAYHSWQN